MSTIRIATAADAETIQTIIRAAEPVDRTARAGVDGSVHWQPLSTWEILIVEQAGEAVGFGAILWPTQDNCHAAEVLIHPEFRGLGFGSKLAKRLLARAAERGIGLRGEYHGNLVGAPGFIQRFGAVEIGRWHQMVVDPLPQSLESRSVPPGYTLRHALAGQDEPAFAAVFRDSFSEHRFMQTPSAENIRERWSNPQFDGNRVALAEYAGDVVGVSAIRASAIYRGDQLIRAGNIGPVGVRTTHRQRGLARALVIDNLQYASRAGWESVSLSVDEVNLHAQALYRSLGFRRHHDWIWWQIPG